MIFKMVYRSHKITVEANKALQTTWKEKMEKKAKSQKIVEINKKMREEKVRKIKAEAERLKNKAKLKELNTFKSASFQIVNTFIILYLEKNAILFLD